MLIWAAWPLFLMIGVPLLILLFSIWIPFWFPRSWGWKRTFIFLFLLIGSGLFFYGDVMLAEYQLNRLCSTKAGIYIYKTVTVPDYMWDFEQGTFKEEFQGFKLLNKNLDAPFIVDDKDSHEYWGVTTDHSYIYERESGDRLVDIVTFRGGGGWLNNSVGGLASVSNKLCQLDQIQTLRLLPDHLTPHQRSLLPAINSLSSVDKFVFQPESYLDTN